MTLETDYRFRLFGGFEKQVAAAYSERLFDASRRADFLKIFNLNPEKLFLVKQVHGENIIRIQDDTPLSNTVMADGLITNLPGITLGILTADCVPVFFWDSAKQVIGLAHAGWRGAMHGIAPKMVAAFQQNFGSQVENIRVGFGPCIRQESYQVGSEFETLFPGFYQPSQVEGKGQLDLAGFIRKSLVTAGVLTHHIEDCGLCTFKETNHFYSYRRENQTRERILSVISMRE
jgi:polyphenol oxidase